MFKSILKFNNKSFLFFSIIQIILYIIQIFTNYNLQVAININNTFVITILIFIILQILFINKIFYSIFVYINFLILAIFFYFYSDFELLFIFNIFLNCFVLFKQRNIIFYQKIIIKLFYITLFLLFFIITLFYISLKSNYNIFNKIDIFLIYPFVFLLFTIINCINIDNSFSTPYKKRIRFLRYIQNFKYSFFILILTIFYKLIYINFSINNYFFIYIFILIISLIYEIRDIYLQNKHFKVPIISFYLLPLFFLFITFLVFWLLTIKFDDSNYKDIISNTLSMVVSIAIFNIASIFILLQLNYSKYGSSYLIIKILKSPILIALTILPSFIILLNVYLIDNNYHIYFLPTLLLILSFFSSFLLFIYFKTVLETNYLLNDLFIEIKAEDYRNYKKNIINMTESKIDSILTITTNIISKNDSISSHSLFYNLSDWIKRNIDQINSSNHNYYEQRLNKFNDFFKILVDSVINSNNNIIHLNFINSVQDILLSEVSSKNYYSFKIVYTMLYNYLFLMLEKKSEILAYEIYNVIYRKSSEILLNLSPIELKKEDDVFVSFNEELKNFEEIFIEKLDGLIDISIKMKNIYFLKKINIYNDLFILGYRDKSSYDKWDAKIIEIYQKLRHLVLKKNQYIIENNEHTFYIEYDYELFMPYIGFSIEKIKYKYQNLISKYLFDSLLSIFIFCINNNKIKSDFDFKLIWEQIFSTIKNNDLEEFSNYFIIFTFLLNLIFENEFKKNDPNISLIKQLWNRIVQIKEYKEIDSCDKGFKIMINKKYSFILKKYKKLKQIEKINYSFKFINSFNIFEEYDIEKRNFSKKNN